MSEETHHKETKHHKESINLSSSQIVAIIVIGLLFVLVAYNSIRIINITSNTLGSSAGASSAITGKAISNIIPTGVPNIYGKELGISYDDVSASTSDKADATIGILANLDNQITLTGNDLQKYISIAIQISCEYCCGAKSIITEDGRSACGCAHSYAMRGLAKYLIKNHGSEYTDDQILEEMGKWKVLFFPDVHVQKAAALESQGIEFNYINLASNKYRGIEKGASGGSMVGGC